MSKKEEQSLLAKLRKELWPVYEKALMALESMGKALAAAIDEHGQEPVAQVMDDAKEVFGISKAKQWVWIRVAMGELPRELAETRIPDSTLCYIPTEAARDLLNEKFVIDSNSDGRRVEKTIDEFSASDVRNYISCQGFSPPSYRGGSPIKRWRVTGLRLSDEKNEVEIELAGARAIAFVPVKKMEALLAETVA